MTWVKVWGDDKGRDEPGMAVAVVGMMIVVAGVAVAVRDGADVLHYIPQTQNGGSVEFCWGTY